LSPRPALALALALAFAAAGCTPRGSPPLSTAAEAIVNGTPDTSAAHRAVVAIRITVGGSRALCSGTLITPRVVLTAAHCAVLTSDPASYLVGFGDDTTGAAMQWLGVDKVRPHPLYTDAAAGADIALLHLSADAPADAVPIPALPGTLALGAGAVGQSADLVGFGDDALGHYGTKLHLALPIGVVCLDQACPIPGGACAPTSLGFVQTTGGTCSGDSGGPALVVVGAQEYVAGITSYGGPGGCLDYGCSTKVDAFQDFIDIFVAGAEKADGAGCAKAIECASGHCVDQVCCDTACDKGACDACSVAAGGAVDGVCAFNHAPCDDGLRCTSGDVCTAGACHGTPLSCPADACHQASSCDPTIGSCRPAANKPDGTACDDGDKCTANDACTGGACAGAPVACPGADACNAARCDPSQGCQLDRKADGTACDDGDKCTRDDACLAGACKGVSVPCAAADDCHEAGTCDPATGACSSPAKADGSGCAAGECRGGSCSAKKKSTGCGAAGGAPLPALAWAALALGWRQRRERFWSRPSR
jgi:uncharacterized protein (TIGR03382 family)